MFTLIKTKIVTTHQGLLPSFLVGDKRKTKLFYISLYLIVLSTFLTIIGQLPFFASHSLTQIFDIGWLITLIPLTMLDYKKLLKVFGISLCIIIPFLIYCLLAYFFNVKSIQYGGTTYVIISLYIFLIGSIFGKYKTDGSTRYIAIAYIIAAAIYAGIVYITKLRGYDLENQIYAFGDKNSAGPIFMAAAILSFYIFNKRKPLSIVLRWLLALYFVLVIALSKNRAVLVIIPLILLMLLVVDIKSIKISIIIILASVGLISLFFVIPWLRENIVIKILFNNKTNIDDITSGRISSIVANFQRFKPILGSGGSYFDCMPLSLLCSYGIIGLLTLLPFLSIPIIILIRYFKQGSNKRLGDILFVLLIMFLVSSIFEGFGYIGTGAKVFIIWIYSGIFSDEVTHKLLKKKTFKFLDLIGSLFAKLPSKTFVYAIQGMLIILPISLLLSPNIVASIGSYVLERTPSTNVTADYVEVKDIQIKSPVSSMCVGQKITWELDVDPIDAEDSTVYWSDGWVHSGVMSVDTFTGEVTALKTGTFLLHILRYNVGPNGVYIQAPVVNVSDYSFDKLCISTKQFSKSFEYKENESISINNGCTSYLFYDDYYLPDSSLIEFISSDNNVATIEGNVIRAKSNGTCEVTAIVHDKNNNVSLNKVIVNVTSDNIFVPVEEMTFDDTQSFYQYEEIELSPTFNSNASDKNFSVTINGLEYTKLNNKITFKEHGIAEITLTSLSNPLLSKKYTIEVKENHPVRFECDTNWIQIGEEKTTKELGLKLIFSNGYKKIITEKDITNANGERAWTGRNGFVGNRTTIKAVTKGIITFTYDSLIDSNVKGSFRITSSVYSYQQYKTITEGIGIVALGLISCIAILFSIFVDFKNKSIICLITIAYVILFSTLTILLFEINVFFYITTFLITAAYIASFIIIHKKSSPIKLLEDPVDY